LIKGGSLGANSERRFSPYLGNNYQLEHEEDKLFLWDDLESRLLHHWSTARRQPVKAQSAQVLDI